MRRWLAFAAVLSLAACGGSSTSEKDSGASTTVTTIESVTATTVALPEDPTTVDSSAVYRMVREFLAQTLAASPGLRERVTDAEQLAYCMVNAGYQINGLPPPGAVNPPTTLVAPTTMISPMLTYLTETCTGVPTADWSGQ